MTDVDEQTEETEQQHELDLTVDGRHHRLTVPTDETLLQALRGRLGVTSARGTCGIGVCGTCTVLVDGRAVSSCLMLAVQVREHEVTTAEGLSDGAELSGLQQAFVRRGAYQCSFCIPAMTLAVQAALDDPDVPHDVTSIREQLAGNLCRCGTYPQILEAVSDVLDDAAQTKGR